MLLSEWLEQQKMTDRQFADLTGVSRECARLWRKKKRTPQTSFVQTIAVITDGKVTAEELERACHVS